MSVTITERPHTHNFSFNEIRYVLQVTDPAAPGCAVDIELYYHDVTDSVGILFKSFTLTPAPDGSVYCQLKDYLDSLLKPQLPVITGAIVQPVRDQVKYFYIRFRQVTTANPEPQWKTDAANKRIVLLGGVEQMKHQGNNFFASYLNTTKAFLTWQPSNRFVFANERHYLTFLLASPADFTVQVHTVFTDLSSHNNSFAFTAGSDVLFRIKTGAHDLGIDAIDTSKKLYYYEVQVVKTADGGILAAPHRFYLEYRPLYGFTDILFFNSLGGIDAVRVKGEVAWSIENSGDDVEHITGNEAINIDSPQAQYSQVNQVKKDNYKGDAGWSRTPIQQEALIELLLSKGRYEIVNSRWIGIVNLKKSLDLRLTTDKKWSFPIEWSYGYSDRVFTPKGIMLGSNIADAPDVPPVPGCVAVTFPAGIKMTNAQVNSAYLYSFDVGGTAPFTLTDIVKPAWMTIAVAGNTVSFTGLPDAVATRINVSFAITNCSNDTATFSDSIAVIAATIPTGNNAFVVNNTVMALQLQAGGVLYPSAPTNSSFPASINPGDVLRLIGGAITIGMRFQVEFRTVISDPPIFAIELGGSESITLSSDPDNPVTGTHNINYITLTR